MLHRVVFGISCLVLHLPAQEPAKLHGKQPATAVIRQVMMLRGDGSPAQGPVDVYIQDGKIVSRLERPAVEVDGAGCYLLPGFVNTHGHLHDRVADQAVSKEYIGNLWLAAGITTVRDNGSNFARSVRLRAQSEKGEYAAPRLLLYRWFGGVDSIDEARERVRSFKRAGADGIKLQSNFSYPPEILVWIFHQARKEGLKVTAHIGVGQSNALTYARNGLRSIEHWYGVPDAAIDGVQDFPPEFNYKNEAHRFRYAGQLWRQADPQRLDDVLAELVELKVAWSPTLAIYEASRDLMRAQNKPYFDTYLHPALVTFFSPGKGYHGSYFQDWTSKDEADWKENYRIWMDALRRYASMGGTITTGEDAGYIYCLYGFTLIREMELHLEAGFHPLQVLRHASYNGAQVLGMAEQFGRILPGQSADLVLVQGNPLRNLKLLRPGGVETIVDGKARRSEGIRWTIKQGRFYHGPTLLEDVRQIVAKARSKRG